MIDLVSKYVTIRPLNHVDIGNVQKAANGDGHSVLSPSHVITKAGEIVGAIEIATSIPVLMWAHTQKMNVRDTLDALRFYENQVFSNTNKPIFLPCKKTSPFLPYLQDPRLGYIDCGEFNFFIKKA